MTDRAELDSTIRSWLKRVPLSAIVILLEAVRDEIGARAVAKLSPFPSPLASHGCTDKQRVPNSGRRSSVELWGVTRRGGRW